MSCQHYFKKLDNFSVCALKANKGVLEVEPDSESCAIYQYVFNGSAKIGRPFESEFFVVNTGDFFSMKDYLYTPRMYEALEDFYMFGFNIQNKDEDWNGRLLKDEELKVENDLLIERISLIDSTLNKHKIKFAVLLPFKSNEIINLL